MRTLISTFILLLAGLALGVGVSWGDLRRGTWPPLELASPKARNERLQNDPLFNPNLPHPRAIAAETKFDFGTMERGGKLSHVFTIKNEGPVPLTLTKGDTTCKCTLSGLDRSELQSGETANVKLEWVAESDNPEFHQSATILTNDPGRAQVRFEVVGKIVQQIRLEPAALFVNKIAGETRSYQVKVTSVNFENLQIVGYSLKDPALASFFDVSYRPLSAEELKANQLGAAPPKGGSLVTVTLKPGLPLGVFQQKIRLATNWSERPEAILHVGGTIEGDISAIGGREWNRDSMLLSLGALRSNQTTIRDLKLMVRGPESGKVNFSVRKVVPEQIKVQLGSASQLAEGRVQQVPLRIEIPRGLPPMTFLGKEQGGFGEIVLATTHPEIPELKLRISFAIEP